MNTSNSDWLIHFGSNLPATKVRLICFPFAGGGVVNYSKWRKDLHETIELCAFNLPGRERFYNRPCLTDYKELITNLATILEKEPDDCPMIFFGHSYGALTAWFTALELKKNHRTGPIHLYASGRVPPTVGIMEPISALDDERFKSVLVERYQGIPQVILNNPDFLAIFLPVIKSDFKLYEQYPQVLAFYADQCINCGITSIGYTDDRTISKEFLDWQTLTHSSHQHLQLPGGHFEILANWKPVVDHINQWVTLHPEP